MTPDESLRRFGTVAFSLECMRQMIYREMHSIEVGQWMSFVPRAYRPDAIGAVRAVAWPMIGEPINDEAMERFIQEVHLLLCTMDPRDPTRDDAPLSWSDIDRLFPGASAMWDIEQAGDQAVFTLDGSRLKAHRLNTPQGQAMMWFDGHWMDMSDYQEMRWGREISRRSEIGSWSRMHLGQWWR